MNISTRRGFLNLAFLPALMPFTTIAQKVQSSCFSKIPANFPPPKFSFGAKVRHKFDEDWKYGWVIGIIWNVETSEWEFQVHWDEGGESCSISSYNLLAAIESKRLG